MIEPCALSLDFPLSVRSRYFLYFFSVSEEGNGAVFLLYFFAPPPLSREGNSGLHSSRFDYSSFYGMMATFVGAGCGGFLDIY